MRISKLILVFLIFASVSVQAKITKYPFLQPTVDMESSIGIMWETSGKNGGTVHYGINNLDKNAQAEFDGINDLGNHRYAVTIKELNPGTVYKYKVISDGEESSEHSFMTSSSSDDFSYRVLIVSDTHYPDDSAAAIEQGNHIMPFAASYSPHLILHCGDMAMGPNDFLATDRQYHNGHSAIKTLLAGAIFAPSGGNHDRKLIEPSGNSYDYSIFSRNYFLPLNGPMPMTPQHMWVREAIYSFSYGGVFYPAAGVGYVKLADGDAGHIAKDLLGWMENGMAAALSSGKVRNIIPFGHVVDGYSSRKGGDVTGRSDGVIKFTNMFDKYNVAALFSGHNHNFTRTFPIYHNGDLTSSIGVFSRDDTLLYNNGYSGTVYHGIASPWYGKDSSPWEGYAINTGKSFWGLATIDVSNGGRKLLVKSVSLNYKDWSGEVVDQYTIERDISVIVGTDKSKAGRITFSTTAFPHPFKNYVNIPIKLNQFNTPYTIKVFDASGSIVKNITNFYKAAHNRIIARWDGRDSIGKEVPVGTYFIWIGSNGKFYNLRKIVKI
ncbi:MAG: fibronectin type III domain-containing protein [bacterium]